MEQQQVQVTVRQQGGQELQELFETPVLGSFVDRKLEQLYGPGALRLEGSNALLAATRALQPAEHYIYIVSAAGGADVEVCAEVVHLSIEGGGAPFSMDSPLYNRKLQVVAIKDTLAAKRLSLVCINGSTPTTDEKGYTVQTFEPGSTVNIMAEPSAAAAGTIQRVPDPSELAKVVSRVELDGEAIGCAARITKDGLCVTAAHCLVDQGKFLKGATAFGGLLQLAGSNPYRDILFVRGPPGDAFELQQSALLVHQDVTLAAYPLAVDKDINSHDQPAITPTVAHGRVVAIATSNELMLADYHAAMPNASGGAVLVGGRLAGIHLGSSYHLDTEFLPEQEEEVPDANRWDIDDEHMWGKGNQPGAQGKSKRRASGDLDVAAAAAAAAELHNLARHAHANIQHKDQLAMFVPVATIIRLGQENNLLSRSDVDKLQHKHAAKSH